MNDVELAAAAVLHFGGRARAEHWLTCTRCFVDDSGQPQRCRQHPDRLAEERRLTATLSNDLAQANARLARLTRNTA